jgi:hypothetical protein
LTKGRGELRAVAAHKRDKKAAEVQVTNRIDHAGKRRQKPGKHQPPSLDQHTASAVRWVANTPGRFRHSCLEKSAAALACDFETDQDVVSSHHRMLVFSKLAK